MKLEDYKISIKHLVDETNDEALLKYWKAKLEWDVAHQQEIDLSDEEWKQGQEGLADYENGETITLEEFMTKR